MRWAGYVAPMGEIKSMQNVSRIRFRWKHNITASLSSSTSMSEPFDPIRSYVREVDPA